MTAITGVPSPEVESGTGQFAINPASNQLTGHGAAACSYDANGNLTSDGALTYAWDALNRMTQVSRDGEVLATYGYDSQNCRVRKTVGTDTTYYLYDLENRLTAEISGSGTVLRECIWLENEPLALREYELRPGLYLYINDHLGTPQQLVTADGTVVWQAAYLPFGEAQVRVGTVTNNLRFPGQYFDAETGLHYNWNRYYDPETGRYISADPIGLTGGMNLYAYVEGDPINAIDPQGLAVGVDDILIWGPLIVIGGAAAQQAIENSDSGSTDWSSDNTGDECKSSCRNTFGYEDCSSLSFRGWDCASEKQAIAQLWGTLRVKGYEVRGTITCEGSNSMSNPPGAIHKNCFEHGMQKIQGNKGKKKRSAPQRVPVGSIGRAPCCEKDDSVGERWKVLRAGM